MITTLYELLGRFSPPERAWVNELLENEKGIIVSFDGSGTSLFSRHMLDEIDMLNIVFLGQYYRSGHFAIEIMLRELGGLDGAVAASDGERLTMVFAGPEWIYAANTRCNITAGPSRATPDTSK